MAWSLPHSPRTRFRQLLPLGIPLSVTLTFNRADPDIPTQTDRGLDSERKLRHKPDEQHVNMAAVWDPWAQAFDLARSYILTSPTPPIRIADSHSNSTTMSTYRLHWNTIASWDNFGMLVQQYWNSVPQVDKDQLVFTRGYYQIALQTLATVMSISTEGNVKVCIDTFPVAIHNAAANGNNGALRPVDLHSRLERWEQVMDGGNNVAGVPDFVMASEQGNLPRRITVMVEVKNPWQVTPALVDAVINSMSLSFANSRPSPT
jgi:hypothetical protein